MKEYNIYIGLLKKDMTTALNKDEVLNHISEAFEYIGIDGFNVAEMTGYWKGKQEPCLKISFLNTFNVDESTLEAALNAFKEVFEQESILYTSKVVRETFI